MVRIKDNKAKAFSATASLINRLPPNISRLWLTLEEIRQELIKGGVDERIDVAFVRGAIRYAGSQFVSRKWNSISYFRSVNFINDSTSPSDRRKDSEWSIPLLKNGLFLESDEVAKIASFIVSIFSEEKKRSAGPLTEETPNKKRRCITDPVPIVTPLAVKLPCPGWSGEKFGSLFRQSLVDQVLARGDLTTTMPNEFGIASAYLNRKGAMELSFQCSSGDNEYVLRSKKCAGHAAVGARYCESCSPFSKIISRIQKDTTKAVDLHPGMKLCASTVAKLTPNDTRELITSIRNEKKKMIRNAREREGRLRNALEKHSPQTLQYKDDMDNVRTILESVEPYIVQKFGAESSHATIWREAIKGLVQPEGGSPRYNEVVLKYALHKLPQVNKAAYESIRKLLFLPTARHVARVKSDLISGDQGLDDGFFHASTKEFADYAQKAGLTGFALQMLVTFDGMIMRNGLLLSTSKASPNKLIGCHLVESEGAVETLFNRFVQKVLDNADETETFKSTMNDALVANREHLVYYAKSLQPGADLCFICAAYNLPTVKAYNIARHVNEVIMGLDLYGFVVRVLCADAAQSNESFFKARCTLPAKTFIPAAILAQHGLDGEFSIGYKHPTRDTAIFVISDPPHALKRVAGAVRNRELIWDSCPMTNHMLYDAFDAVEKAQGPMGLLANHKLSHSHFFCSRWEAMKVKKAAQMLSGTMVNIIDTACANPTTYPMETGSPDDRTRLFSKLRELCSHMNRFFDLCNGKDKFNPFAKASPNTGEGYANEFLSVLAWFNEWNNWASNHPGEKKANAAMFVPAETFKSLKFICYGFAALIYEECIGNKHTLSLSKVNQDVCEHHFGNVRRNVKSHANPNQVEAMSAVRTSSILRLDNVIGSNCTKVQKDDQRTCLKLEAIRRNAGRNHTRCTT